MGEKVSYFYDFFSDLYFQLILLNLILCSILHLIKRNIFLLEY
jgi:hypothetical protein